MNIDSTSSTTDQQPQTEAAGVADNTDAQSVSASRRQFTRGAALGGAVLLSLANRSAWGGQVVEGTCVSAPTMASFVANGNQFLSARPDEAEMTQAAEMIVEVNNKSHRSSYEYFVETVDDQMCVRRKP